MAIQFYYFTNNEGEKIIQKLLLDTFLGFYYFNDQNDIFLIDSIKDFDKIGMNLRQLYLYPIHYLEEKKNHFSLYENPIIDYTLSKKEDNIHYSGWISFYAVERYPDLKKKINSLFSKLKKKSWRDKNFSYWVFNEEKDNITAFVPNREVILSK